MHLIKHNINLSTVKKKIAIEIAWNDYIVQKFNNSVLVDELKLETKLINYEKIYRQYLLSEIIFTINENENFEKKLK